MKKLSFSNEEHSYINSLYNNTNGFVKIMCGHNRKGIFTQAPALCNEKKDIYFNSKHLDLQNTMMSMSTYISKGSACEKNINTVCCLAVDVDYTFVNKNGQKAEPLLIWEMLKRELIEYEITIPMPTYIEYGHRLRLVYLLKSPVCLRIKDSNKRKSTITWLKRIMTIIAENINSLNPAYNAEIQNLTKFVRVPGSYNIKYDQEYCKADNRYYFKCNGKYIISVKEIPNGKILDIKELSDFVLPILPTWYHSYKNKKEYKPLISIKNKNHNLANMLQNRLAFLECLQDKGWNIGYREIMCFLYYNFSLQLGLSNEEAKRNTCMFNARFKNPLNEKKMLSHATPRKLYNYKNRTLMELLGLTELEAKGS